MAEHHCRDCGNPYDGTRGAKGRCNACYHRWRRAGRPADTPAPPPMPATAGYSPAAGTARWDLAS